MRANPKQILIFQIQMTKTVLTLSELGCGRTHRFVPTAIWVMSDGRILGEYFSQCCESVCMVAKDLGLVVECFVSLVRLNENVQSFLKFFMGKNRRY